jgi:transposase
MKAKRAPLVQALTGQFDEHHAELARMLLDQIDGLSAQIDKLTARVEQLIADLPAEPVTGAPAGDPHSEPLPVLERLTEIPGIARRSAQVILAEIGLDMTRFPTASHLVSWAKLCPRTIQSGAKSATARAVKGNPYLKGILGEAAAAAAKTSTFLGERHRRVVKRRGKLRALVAVARSILVNWHLLADPTARYYDLGADYHDTRIDKDRKAHSHIRQLEALGFTVTLATAA